MKSLSLKTAAIASSLACLMAFYSAPVIAGEYDWDYRSVAKFKSTKTRTDVRAEYSQAVKDGTLAKDDWDTRYVASSPASTLTREQVRAEYFQAVKDGTLAKDDWDTRFIATNPASTLTREAVQAETQEWLRANRAERHMGSK